MNFGLVDRRQLLAGATVLPSLLREQPALAQEKSMFDAATALIVVDVQNDFCPGGALPVAKGDEVVPVINALGKRFSSIVMTQDWHPAGHASFASSHPGKKPFDMVPMPYGQQVLWPDHCIQGSKGAELRADLVLPTAQTIIRKGYRPEIDSYSGFLEADRKTPTGLGGYLRERGVKRVVLVGLATDFCVNWTAQDAAKAGLETLVVEDACRAIDLNGSLAKAWAEMTALGVKRVEAARLPG